MSGESGILVLGVGNVLMGDEGVGVEAVRTLGARGVPAGVEIVDGGTGGFHLLEYLESGRRVILIDAALDGAAPGTVRVVRPRFARDLPPNLSAHDIGLKQLLDAAALLGKAPEVRLVTVSVAALPEGLALDLSAPVRAALPEVLRRVDELIAELRELELRESP